MQRTPRHRSVPAILREVNRLMAELGWHIENQTVALPELEDARSCLDEASGFLALAESEIEDATEREAA